MTDYTSRQLTTNALTDGDRKFFADYGYLILRGALKSDIHWIQTEFDRLFREIYDQWHVNMNPDRRRYMITPFIDRSPRLATLLDHPAIDGVLTSLFGENWSYLPGEGNYFHGGTGWHTDGPPTTVQFTKIAVYLEPVARGTGCLQFVAGSHQPGYSIPPPFQLAQTYDGQEVPAVAAETEPGDLLVFHHMTYHASAGHQTQRRMFTINACPPLVSAQDADEFRSYLDRTVKYAMNRTRQYYPAYLMNTLYDTNIIESAPPARLSHLQLAKEWDPVVAQLCAEYLRSPLQGWHW